MIKNYLTIAVRNMLRNKGYSAINIGGLAVGMAVCILISLWVGDELSYDRFHVNADRIHLCWKKTLWETDVVRRSAAMPGPVGPTVKDKVPEITDYARLLSSDMGLRRGADVYPVAGYFADPSFLTMFSFRLLEGDPGIVLSTPNSIVLTQETAAAVFGDGNPIGEVFDNGLTVTGVVADVPRNSTIEFDYLAPMSYAEQEGIVDLDDWYTHGLDTYVLLHRSAIAAEVSPKISSTFTDHVEEGRPELFIQPLTDVHLRRLQGGGRITYVYIFGCVAVLVLVVASINYMNLTTARSMRRAKEIGLRKTVGAGRSQLILQVLSESLITAVVALVLALCLVELFIPFFNNLSGKQLALDLSEKTVLLVALVGLITGLLAGSYPALFLSSLRPVTVLKGKSMTGGFRGAHRLRRVLVVFQLALSVFLVFGSSVIHGQRNYAGTTDLGLHKDNILCVRTDGLERDHEVFRSELSQHGGVLGVTGAWQPPARCGWWIGSFDFEGRSDDQDIRTAVAWVDFNYVDVFGLEIVEGRPFVEQHGSAEQDAYIVNETAARAMGMESPVGRRIGSTDGRGKIVGVVKDYHFTSLHNDIEPLVLAMDESQLRYLCIKIAEDNVAETIGFLREKWEEFRPGQEFRYRFFDELLSREYRAEQRAGTIVECFTLLAILIAGMGLFGLAAHSAEQRTREVGIRKALGASVFGIVRLMLSELMILVLVAAVVGLPLAYYASDRWLASFAYRIHIGWETFLVAVASVLAVALVTVSYQAIKAARADPVEALKYE